MTEDIAKPAAADEALIIPGPAGRIEAALDCPEGDAPAQPVLAIVCHPLPTEGGSMHNKVVTMTARALRESGVTTLRFNFRGVGQSEGSFDDGAGELDGAEQVPGDPAKRGGGDPEGAAGRQRVQGKGRHGALRHARSIRDGGF